MKLLVRSCLILLFAVFVVAYEYEAIEEITRADEVFREEYCAKIKNHATEGKCSSLRCNKDNTKTIKIACAEARCSGKTVGFKGDPLKSYPDCCKIPICEEPNE